MPTYNFRKKNSFTHHPMYFAFTFPECIKITSFEEALKVCEHNFFQEIQVESSNLLVIYQFNYDSSKSTFVMLNMAFDVLFSTFFLHFLLFPAIIQRLQEHPSYCSVFWYVLFYKGVTVLHLMVIIIFYFETCIKFTLSVIISTMKKW